MESFSIDLIIGIKDLSELQVPTDIKDKTKWKKSVHQIQNRKRRALSELFKSLANFALSYRKGLVIDNELDVNHIIMTTGSFDFDVSKKAILSSQLIEDINDCNKYFYKCLARFTALRTQLQNPNKELPIGTIERIRGFSAHLMKKVIENRKSISQKLYFYKKIKTIEHNLNKVTKTSDLLIIPKKQLTSHLESLQSLIVRTISFIFRSIDLLSSLSTSIEEPILVLTNDQNVTICEHDINELNNSLNSNKLKLIDLIEKIKLFGISDENSVYTLQDLRELKNNFKTFSSLMNELRNRCFLQNNSYTISLIKNFSILFDETTVLCTKFDNYSDHYIKLFETINSFGNMNNQEINNLENVGLDCKSVDQNN